MHTRRIDDQVRVFTNKNKTLIFLAIYDNDLRIKLEKYIYLCAYV